jgi:hypothetical protein
MTEKEVDELISSLRELTSTHDRYVLRHSSENRIVRFEYLLDDGTLINSDNGVACQNDAKEQLKNYLLNSGYTFVGVGVFHKAL